MRFPDNEGAHHALPYFFPLLKEGLGVVSLN